MSEKIKDKFFEIVDSINDQIIKIRRDLHSYPELSDDEKETSKMVKELLEKYGYEVKKFDTHYGLIAYLKPNKNQKTIAIRADMDALPITEQTGKEYASKIDGVMHACGHDSHTAIALGTAIAFSKIKDSFNGNVRFIFQHAEEGEGGSLDMIEGGALDGASAILGLHAYPYLPTGQIGYKYGVMMASADMFTIEIFGKSSHGARPHEGVDAILVTSMIVNSLNHIVSRRIDPLHPAVISLGTIEGGKTSNIICDHVILTGTVRTVNDKIRNKIPDMMRESIKGVCKSMGAKFNFDYTFYYPELINEKSMVNLLVKEATNIIGEQNCIDLKDPVMGGEDFAEYLKVVNGTFFRLGTCNENKQTCHPQHNSKFDVDDDALKIGMKIMGACAIEFLETSVPATLPNELGCFAKY